MTPLPVSLELLSELSAAANDADAQAVWPAAAWEALRRGGVLTWSIPKAHGGEDRGITELLDGYGDLAEACLTTCFILSQREAAVRRIIDHGNETIQRELLPALARGDTFTTVGLSQLSTARQHGKPAVTVREAGDKLIFDGVIPWVSGAPHADYFIAGAELSDGRQLLAVLHRDLPGVRVGPPMDLMALEGSLTAEVICTNAEVDRRWLLAGPTERVMTSGGRGGTGGLETSCLALGLANAAIKYLFAESASRPELRGLAERLDEPCRTLRKEMLQLATGGATPDKSAVLRGHANTLVLQATQTALAASKGTGFLRSHPAQRWARQAMFFLVWSCPRPAVEATLAYLAPSDHEQFCS
ncbi:MAG: acyl-CoA/acyl-ACP dehydrogenase [Gemmataceae bacterium]|nr:acyl-CoA/acyl-ACP dehydrogenase [Gemmataceae bacterium]